MKGILYTEGVWTDVIHGMGFTQTRLYIPDKGISVWPYELSERDTKRGKVVVVRCNLPEEIKKNTKEYDELQRKIREAKRSGKKLDHKLDFARKYQQPPAKIVGEIDIPNEQVAAFLALLTAQEAANEFKHDLNERLQLKNIKAA